MSESDGIDFKSVLASTVHDMKNSLSMLVQGLDALCTSLYDADPATNSQLASVQYEAARVNNDLVRLLCLYKLDQDLLVPQIQQWQVRDLLEECQARYQPLFEARHIQCEIACGSSIEAWMDRELVAGVIGNIIANAVRYSKRRIRLSAERSGSGVTLICEDDGKGFPESMLARPEHESGVGSADFHSGSTQLGLYFASRIAGLHRRGEEHGSILLNNESRLGGGLFSLFLP